MCNFPSICEIMTDRPTNQPADGHKGSQGSYTSSKYNMQFVCPWYFGVLPNLFFLLNGVFLVSLYSTATLPHYSTTNTNISSWMYVVFNVCIKYREFFKDRRVNYRLYKKFARYYLHVQNSCFYQNQNGKYKVSIISFKI